MGAIDELLAEVAAFEGRGNESVDILEAGLERTKRTFGERSEEYATALWELGSAQYGVGDLDGAHETLLRARALFEERGKTDSLDYAYTMQTLAHLVGVLGDPSTAVSLFEASLPIKARVLGRDHRKVGHTHTYIASEALVAGDQEKAERHFALAEEIYAPVFAHTLTTGTAAQRYRYTKKYYWLTDTAVSAYIDGGLETREAARRAYRSVLRVKGRALEGSAASYRVIRGDRSSRTRQIAQRFAALHAEAAELALVGQRGGRSVAAVLAEADELERQMNSSADQTVGPTYVPSIREIAAALPEQTALVELAIYEPSFGALVGEAPRYAAFVIDRSGLVALGPVAATSEADAAAAELRSAIRACGAAGVECGKGEWEKAIDQAAKALSAVTIERLGEVIDGYDHLLIAPDGALNLVPFAMLPDRHGRPLIDTYSITYLTSGRDLFASGDTPPSRQPPVVVADPDFGSSRGAAARTLLDGEWETLEGTAAEAAAIAKLFPEARVLTRRDATEAAIKGLKSPGFLHVATHGFFVNGDSPIAGAATRGLKRKETQPESQAASVEAVNPLIRTGLAFAGANRLESGDEDGILTALELGDIDLTGTELVALSACDTGVGEVRTGAGVYGLRRALIMAGAASQLMSLWPVDDQVTRQLMTAYYEALGRGEGRSQALRTAQLTVRAERANPYYWASFIPSGDWAPLGRSARRAAPTSPPGAAGPEVVRNEAGSSFGAPGLPALSLMLGGLGVSAASVGLGFWAKSTNDSLQDGSVRTQDSVDSMYTRAKRLGLAADIGLVVGGAALATGAVLWLTGVSREAAPVAVAVSDHGAFVRMSGSF
jgi:CHAT domain-containing protein